MQVLIHSFLLRSSIWQPKQSQWKQRQMFDLTDAKHSDLTSNIDHFGVKNQLARVLVCCVNEHSQG